jgi:hypothetical protein
MQGASSQMSVAKCQMPGLKKLLGIILLTLLVVVVGCSSETREILSGLQLLSEDVAQEFGESQPNVNRTIDTITLTFINPTFASFDATQKAAKAKEIATFAKAHYKGIESCKNINIVVVKQTNYLVIKFGSSEPFRFEKDEL